MPLLSSHVHTHSSHPRYSYSFFILSSFTFSYDSILTHTAIFSPKSKDELQSAVDSCLTLSPAGDCILGEHGPIGNQWDVSLITDMEAMFYIDIAQFNADLSKWNVSRVTDMGRMFKNARSFDADLSNWVVSRVTNMWAMFKGARAFKADLSHWDVSRVTSMGEMFFGASLFKHVLCGVAWVNSGATKIDMFLESPGSISTTVCST